MFVRRSLLFAVLALSAAVLLRHGPPFNLSNWRGSIRIRKQHADVTAIVLNWSRLPNVVKIVSVLCDPSLADVVQNVTVWNNNPQPLNHTVFAVSKCPAEKLHIFNSPSNVYFQARFIACQQASTPYCFIQDDDYLIWPEIIRIMRARIPESSRRGIHLLPPHEMLSSTLRRIRVGPEINTGFAWLGHGAMVSRSRVTQFLQLMTEYLNATEEELRMADNYYTILANMIPEIWFDQGVELGGGQPFTVGVDGDTRNKKHIMRAVQLLEAVIHDIKVPYVQRVPNASSEEIMPPSIFAPCYPKTCLFESNISILPGNVTHLASSATDMLDLETHNLETIGAFRRQHYLKYPPSYAVDGRAETAFCHFGVKAGDFFLLDTTRSITLHNKTELVLLTDVNGLDVLRYGVFDATTNGAHWEQMSAQLNCAKNSHSDTQTNLFECSISINKLKELRGVRAGFLRAFDKPWCLHEIWLKGV